MKEKAPFWRYMENLKTALKSIGIGIVFGILSWFITGLGDASWTIMVVVAYMDYRFKKDKNE